MKTGYLLAVMFLLALPMWAQREGQSFCDGNPQGDWFTLWPVKKILWGDTFYKDFKIGTKVISGASWEVFVQEWKDGDRDTLYFRKEGSKTYEYYEKTGLRVLRLDEQAREGDTWKGKDRSYRVLSTNATFHTRYCWYSHLLALEARFDDGATYTFYYLRGFGYVGAGRDGKIISCVVPEV